MTTEARRAQQKAWREKNRDKVLAAKKRYREKPETREKERAYHAEYMATHPEAKARQAERHAIWQRENRDKINEKQRERYRAKCAAKYKEGTK